MVMFFYGCLRYNDDDIELLTCHHCFYHFDFYTADCHHHTITTSEQFNFNSYLTFEIPRPSNPPSRPQGVAAATATLNIIFDTGFQIFENANSNYHSFTTAPQQKHNSATITTAPQQSHSRARIPTAPQQSHNSVTRTTTPTTQQSHNNVTLEPQQRHDSLALASQQSRTSATIATIASQQRHNSSHGSGATTKHIKTWTMDEIVLTLHRAATLAVLPVAIWRSYSSSCMAI